MKNLNEQEMKSINGGNVPTAYYMDDATIAQNGQSFSLWGKIIWNTAKPFFREIVKFVAEIA
jgi:bacteriocin-like protein